MRKIILIILSLTLIMTLVSCGEGEKESDMENTSKKDNVDPAPDTVEHTGYVGEFTFTNTEFVSKSVAEPKDEPFLVAAYKNEELTGGDYILECELTFNDMFTYGGLIFAVEETEAGFKGYSIVLRTDSIYLGIAEYNGTAVTNETIFKKGIEGVENGVPTKIRIEREGFLYRVYVLDDMPGVEPWPEFETTLADLTGTGIGIIDNGYGSTVKITNIEEAFFMAPSGQVYANPVGSDSQGADPGVLFWDGMYYCYATSEEKGYNVYSSPDLVNWENRGKCIESAWGREKWYWAPEVIEHNGKFYMIMSVEERIGFAVADHPLGPFIPEETWLFEGAIDGHIFKDDDGRLYLYFVTWRNGYKYGIYGCELNDDVVTVKPGTHTHIISPKENWEAVDSAITEGPFVLKHNGLYYLTYSGSSFGSKAYAVGYATSDSPLGKYKRYDKNPILSYTCDVYGPGHHCITTSPNGEEMFIVYHTHKNTSSVHPRIIYIDRIRFAPTASGVDKLEVYGPTLSPQPYPKS